MKRNRSDAYSKSVCCCKCGALRMPSDMITVCGKPVCQLCLNFYEMSEIEKYIKEKYLEPLDPLDRSTQSETLPAIDLPQCEPSALSEKQELASSEESTSNLDCYGLKIKSSSGRKILSNADENSPSCSRYEKSDDTVSPTVLQKDTKAYSDFVHKKSSYIDKFHELHPTKQLENTSILISDSKSPTPDTITAIQDCENPIIENESCDNAKSLSVQLIIDRVVMQKYKKDESPDVNMQKYKKDESPDVNASILEDSQICEGNLTSDVEIEQVAVSDSKASRSSSNSPSLQGLRVIESDILEELFPGVNEKSRARSHSPYNSLSRKSLSPSFRISTSPLANSPSPVQKKLTYNSPPMPAKEDNSSKYASAPNLPEKVNTQFVSKSSADQISPRMQPYSPLKNKRRNSKSLPPNKSPKKCLENTSRKSLPTSSSTSVDTDSDVAHLQETSVRPKSSTSLNKSPKKCLENTSRKSLPTSSSTSVDTDSDVARSQETSVRPKSPTSLNKSPKKCLENTGRKSLPTSSSTSIDTDSDVARLQETSVSPKSSTSLNKSPKNRWLKKHREQTDKDTSPESK